MLISVKPSNPWMGAAHNTNSKLIIMYVSNHWAVDLISHRFMRLLSLQGLRNSRWVAPVGKVFSQLPICAYVYIVNGMHSQLQHIEFSIISVGLQISHTRCSVKVNISGYNHHGSQLQALASSQQFKFSVIWMGLQQLVWLYSGVNIVMWVQSFMIWFIAISVGLQSLI